MLSCLTVECPENVPPLSEALKRLRDTGCTIFEAVVGAPLARYGPRVTLDAGSDPPAKAHRLGQGGHPWGPPVWYGLRIGPDGEVKIKPYHRVRRLDDRFTLPAGLPDGLVPQLASLDGDRTELYLRCRPALPWHEFAGACMALLDARPPLCAPHPRRAESAHCVSLSWAGADLAAVTVYAQDRCLPDDRTIARQWVDGLDDVDRRTYEAAVAGVRAAGRPGHRGWHAMLSWTVQADGQAHRAVSLRIADAGVRTRTEMGSNAAAR